MDPEMIRLFNLCGSIRDMILENEALKADNAALADEIKKIRRDREEGFRIAAEGHKQVVEALISGQLTINREICVDCKRVIDGSNVCSAAGTLGVVLCEDCA